MWQWRSLRRLHHEADFDVAKVIVDLAGAELKTEVCKSVNGLSAQFLDIPEDVSKYWWRTGRDHRRLFIRRCYDPIFKKTFEHNMGNATAGNIINGVVLLGSPGIGKTGFLWLALWRLLKEKLNVILKVPVHMNYVCASWCGNKLAVEEHSKRKEIPRKMWEHGQPWYLADRLIEEPDWTANCKFLLTCSPLKTNYHGFAKGGGVRLLYDPVWTHEEVLALNEHNFGHDVEEVNERFRMWGGVPRYVLDRVEPDEKHHLDHAAGLVRDFKAIIKDQAMPETQSHKAFHMIVNEETYTSYKLAPASHYVQEKLVQSLPFPTLTNFLSVPQAEDIRDIQGKLLEQFLCDVVVPQGGRLKFRELQNDGEFGPVYHASFPGAAPKYHLPSEGGYAVFPKDIPRKHKAAVFKPISPTNGEWDFLANECIYQVTVQKERELRLGEALVRALTFLRFISGRKKLEFCFLVPVYNLPLFTIDWFATVKSEEEEKGTRRSQALKPKLVIQGMKRIKELNIKVKVASMGTGDVCPSCMGSGTIAEVDNVIAAVSRFASRGKSSD